MTLEHSVGQAEDGMIHLLLADSHRLHRFASVNMLFTNIYPATIIRGPQQTAQLRTPPARVTALVADGLRHFWCPGPGDLSPSPVAGTVLFDTEHWPNEQNFRTHCRLILAALAVMAAALGDQVTARRRPLAVLSPYKAVITGVQAATPASSAHDPSVDQRTVATLPAAARDFLRIPPDGLISYKQWIRFFATGRNLLASFLVSSTSMSGGGATYAGVILIMVRHNTFTRFLPRALVTTTRGEITTWVFAPGPQVVSQFLPRTLLCPCPPQRGLCRNAGPHR